MRIGDIELQFSNDRWELVRWKRREFGWGMITDDGPQKRQAGVDEYCYTLAWFDRDSESYFGQSVGMRLFQEKDQERELSLMFHLVSEFFLALDEYEADND